MADLGSADAFSFLSAAPSSSVGPSATFTLTVHHRLLMGFRSGGSSSQQEACLILSRCRLQQRLHQVCDRTEKQTAAQNKLFLFLVNIKYIRAFGGGVSALQLQQRCATDAGLCIRIHSKTTWTRPQHREHSLGVMDVSLLFLQG